MKLEDKVNYLKTHHMSQYVETRQQVEQELSDAQSMFCCCGKLATGMHERYCSKFNRKVESATIGRLKNLLP